tara:strand:+ start:2146 stop:2730 length:585 start_codon:yes stop_codon:yes gene_type:complete
MKHLTNPRQEILMGNSTFSGPVRSEGGFQIISKNATTGTETTVASTASTGIVTNKFVKHVGFASGVTVNTTAGDSPAIGEFTQPANTIITDIKIFCDVSPVIGSGDIGYEVGTSSSGAQIVAAQTDEILDAGTTVVVHNVTITALVLQTQDGTTAPASVQYTDTERTIFCNITNTVDATTAGSFTFIIEYVQIA